MNFTDLRIMKTQERLQNALLELMGTKELKAITVKEICSKAGISRNAFYQHYSYKEDLYYQMVAQATEKVRNSLKPIIPDIYHLKQDSIRLYSKQVIQEVSAVRDLISVMLKGDDGKFLAQLSDLIFGQFLTNAIPFYNIEDTAELRLYYEFLSAGMAAFMIRWVLDDDLTDNEAEALLAEILVQTSTKIPAQLRKA